MSAGTEFPDTIDRLYIVFRAVSSDDPNIFAYFRAVAVEGFTPDADLGSLCIRPGCDGASRTPKGWVLAWKGSLAGFVPGEYRVRLEGPGDDVILSFTITPALPKAGSAAEAADATGYNVALAAFGGRIVAVTSEENDGDRGARNLIDGLPMVISGLRACRPSCGWVSASRRADTVEAHRQLFPQDVVFGFHQDREAQIHALIVDTTSYQQFISMAHRPRQVEVWVSPLSPTEGFTRAAAAWLEARQGEHLVAFPAVRARYVRLRILSNYGGRAVHAGEVKILESPEAPSILADVPKNIALAADGGAVARYSSLRQHYQAGALIDGSVTGLPWVSADGYLPQDLVLAFRGDREALVDRVVITPGGEGSSYAGQENWPKVVAISVSSISPLGPFEEVGQFTVPQEARGHAFPVSRRARFVRVRILKNYGGAQTSLAELAVIEGAEAGYQSILLRSSDPAAAAGGPAAQTDEPGIALERETNNTAAEANTLELARRLKGIIDPLGEQDHFRLTVPGSTPQVLTFELLGRPYLRTSLTLSDASGQALRRFDPAQAAGARAEFSWLVRPGDLFAQLTEPPVSLVMIWDTSGSMGEDSVANLRRAVDAYLSQVTPSERLNLIRFSGQAQAPDPPHVEVLLPEFTGDPARLRAAAQEKFFAKGATPFYDAVAKGIELLEGRTGNRAIVVMTDGVDTSSALDRAGFWSLLARHRIRLYTIGLGTELPVYDPLSGTSGRRFLAHAALGTGARAFFTENPERLASIYQEIAAEMRTPTPYYLRATLSGGPGTLAVTASGERIASVSAPSAIELILDASGSMKRPIGGRPMMDVAKEVMAQIITQLPDDAQVALRFYGHRIRQGRRGDCQDSELVVPFGRIDKARLLARVRSVRALGTTPIAYTLRQVGRDFGGAPGEKLVVLVTDGKEECGGSPSAVVAELAARGLKVRLNIVGFALADEAVKREMERVARITGGRFFDAKDAAALRQSIEQALAVPFDVLDAAGARVGGGITGQPVRVPAGVYTVMVRAAGPPMTVREVRVIPGGFTKVALRKEGQEVGVQVIGP
ncbi:MAG: VWA domain-containing protein [Armatimonadota bacterium]|nr:VWA domain-containing protein [Armatimonadota bacterium]MDR7466451.1 VWA domain-containing protein [Armatimonadota bacterium]MDR7503536.1 VWA domain-containing protein [Armatimonadota bacterium]MDR7551466.1 VWA domain-containing protein [Armatimonadota bacterium]